MSGGDLDRIETRAAFLPQGSSLAVQVTILSGSRKGAGFALTQRLTIGKAPDNDIVLSDDTVSRHHCELVRTSDGIVIRDLGSTNGTRVSGARVQEGTFPPGTVLKVGEVEIGLRPAPQKLDLMPSDKTSFGPAIGHSVSMRTIFALLERIAPTDATVLLEGETGTGKDVLARAVVGASKRANKPFVIVDCGAVSYSLIESELFGHERGAFTGAIATRQGAFELADGGTVFLDEIGELPLDVQPKLLRLLEMREFRRVGGNKIIHTDVRVIAATKRDLAREVGAGKFREDVYFRLAVVPVTVPPLRLRREDIRPLVESFVKDSGLTLSPEAVDSLMAHDWPGNIRELRNVLERAIYMARGSGSGEVSAISFPVSASSGDNFFQFEQGASYRDTRAKFDGEFETRYVKWLLGRHNGNVSAAAREARMDRKHLYDMAKKHGLRDSEG